MSTADVTGKQRCSNLWEEQEIQWHGWSCQKVYKLSGLSTKAERILFQPERSVWSLQNHEVYFGRLRKNYKDMSLNENLWLKSFCVPVDNLMHTMNEWNPNVTIWKVVHSPATRTWSVLLGNTLPRSHGWSETWTDGHTHTCKHTQSHTDIEIGSILFIVLNMWITLTTKLLSSYICGRHLPKRQH